MDIMYRSHITIICKTEDETKKWTDSVLAFVASKRDSGIEFVGCDAIEDNYLIADEKTIEADKEAFLLLAKPPAKVPLSSTKDATLDLTRIVEA